MDDYYNITVIIDHDTAATINATITKYDDIIGGGCSVANADNNITIIDGGCVGFQILKYPPVLYGQPKTTMKVENCRRAFWSNENWSVSTVYNRFVYVCILYSYIYILYYILFFLCRWHVCSSNGPGYVEVRVSLGV